MANESAAAAPHRILVVDDEPDITALVAYHLAKDGYRVTTAGTGADALRSAREERPDLVVLDLMLPGHSGFEVLAELRRRDETRDVGVLLLTARKDEPDRIKGLSLGADDYLAKPFNPRELLARVRAVLRRGASEAPRTRFVAGGLVIDFDAREVTVDGRRVVLTHHEFELLAALARAGGRVLSREQLMDALKGQDYDAFDRSIDVHVSKVRAKIEKDAKAPRYVKTVRGIGYALVRPGPAR